MFLEHFVFSAALAVLAGMVFYHYTRRDPSWIIILSALAPDVDTIAHRFLHEIGIGLLLNGSPIKHGTFHNIVFMVLFGIAMAFILHPLGIRFLDSLLFATIGFGAHLLEDASVLSAGYTYFWPFSTRKTGLGILTDMLNEDTFVRDFFGLANSETLIIALLLFLAAFLFRTWIVGSTAWIRFYMPAFVYRRISGTDPETGTAGGAPRER